MKSYVNLVLLIKSQYTKTFYLKIRKIDFNFFEIYSYIIKIPILPIQNVFGPLKSMKKRHKLFQGNHWLFSLSVFISFNDLILFYENLKESKTLKADLIFINLFLCVSLHLILLPSQLYIDLYIFLFNSRVSVCVILFFIMQSPVLGNSYFPHDCIFYFVFPCAAICHC